MLLLFTILNTLTFKVKNGGGMSFTATCPLTYLNEKLIRSVLHEYSNCMLDYAHEKQKFSTAK